MASMCTTCGVCQNKMGKGCKYPDRPKTVIHGDKIVIKGVVFLIDTVHYQHYDVDTKKWTIQYTDSDNMERTWNQEKHGGEVVYR